MTAPVEPASDGDDPRLTPWWALDDFCARQVRRHHGPLRQSMAGIRDEASALARDYGAEAPLLLDVAASVEVIAATLLSHLAKEENILFPAFAALAAAWREARGAPALPFPTVRFPISLLETEHDRLARALARLRELTESLALPAEAADRWRIFHAALHRFELDLHADTSLEDDVLFPRALELERALL